LIICIELLKRNNPLLSQNYLKRSIGIRDQYKSNNMVLFWPKKAFLRIGSKNSNKDLWIEKLEEAGITVFKERKGKRIHLRVTKDEINKNEELFKELFSDAYKADSET